MKIFIHHTVVAYTTEIKRNLIKLITSNNKLRGCRVRPTRYVSARVQEPNFI